MVDSRGVSKERPSGRSADAVAVKVALLYAAVTTVWILGSGQVVLLLPPEIARIVEIYKGLGFTVLTTILLFFAIRSWARRFASQVQSTRESQLRTEQIVHAIPAGVLLVGADGAIEFANPEAERVMGLSSTEMVGVPLELVIHPEEPTAGDMFGLLRDGLVEGLGIRANDAGRGRAIIASAARLGTAESGAGWVLALSDITRSHLENERIRRLVRGYRLISGAMHAVQTARTTRQLLETVAEAAATDGALAGAWAAAPDESGAKLVTVAQHGLSQQVLDRIEAASLHNPQYNLDGVAQQLGEGHLYVVNDIAADPLSPFLGLDPTVLYGSSVTFVVTAPMLPLAVLSFFSDEVGFFDQEQIRLVEILRDAIVFAVSKFELDAKRFDAEDLLERSENAYRQMFDKNPEPIWVYDVGTLGILAVNEAAVRKYGYSAEEFARMTLIDLQPTEDIPRLLDTVAHYSAGVPGDGYFTHIDKSGHMFAVHVRSNSVNWNGVDARLALIQEVATVS